jgi:hypothetical protein
VADLAVTLALGGDCLSDIAFRRSGGVLVGPADGGVDVHVPGDSVSPLGWACGGNCPRSGSPGRTYQVPLINASRLSSAGLSVIRHHLLAKRMLVHVSGSS